MAAEVKKDGKNKEIIREEQVEKAKQPKIEKGIEKVFISEADQYLFSQGTHYDIYKKLGAHVSEEDGKKGIYFGVWAPNAAEVHVVGGFNQWQIGVNPMQKLGPVGIWGLFVPEVEPGEMYKFLIVTPDGRHLYKADPFANYAEYRPGTASVITDLSGLNGRMKSGWHSGPRRIFAGSRWRSMSVI